MLLKNGCWISFVIFKFLGHRRICKHATCTFNIEQSKVLFLIYPDVRGCSNDTSLYFIDEHNIRCIDLKTSNHTYVNVHTVQTGLVEAGAIDVDHRSRMVYWSDNSLWTINRMNLDTSETEVMNLSLSC